MSNKFLVSKNAMRPASSLPECFYCGTAIGGYHKDDCVLIRKKVLVRAIVEYEVDVPAFWESPDVESHRNDSSWCASNMIKELEKLDDDEGCLCSFVRYEYIKDVQGVYLDEG